MSSNQTHGLGDARSYQKGTAYVAGRGGTVRIRLPDGTETGLCTFTYSYNMSENLKQYAAERFVAMWNACKPEDISNV